MSKRFEIRIEIFDGNYIDSLIVALARQGYAPYYNQEEHCVCFTASDEDITEITKG